MTHEDQVYTICEAHSANKLITEINKEVKRLAENYRSMTIQSVSHNVLTQPYGPFIWTALIVANVKGQEDEEDHH